MVQNGNGPYFQQVSQSTFVSRLQVETSTHSEWEYGSIFERADAPFKAVEQVKAMLNIFTQIGGSVSTTDIVETRVIIYTVQK